jgi:radical SAM superfamily enzyme YgiQ (UPF0313 family)
MIVGLVQARQLGLGSAYRLNAPLSCAVLAGCLERAGIEAEAIDLDGLGQDENFLLDGMEHFDAFGISALSSQAEGARRLIKLLKYHQPNKYVVCGGVDPTLFPQKYLDWGADCVVTGEAEGNVVQVFTEQPKGQLSGIPGDIDPMPMWDRVAPPPWEYPGHPDPLALPESLVMLTRGCPHSCTFCGNPYKGRQVRKRSLEVVDEELTYLAEHGVKGIFLYDDEIVDKNLLTYLHRALSLSKSRFLFRAQGRCNMDLHSLPVLRELRDMGLRRVMWGIESFANPVLKAIHKDTDKDGILQTLNLSHAAGIENFGFLMTGLPEETPELAASNLEALKLCLETKLLNKIQVLPCTPMPGTELYEQAKANGWLFEGDAFQAEVKGGTPWMSQGEIAEHTMKMRLLGHSYGA